MPDEALPLFMSHCNKRIGEAYFRTPRNTIKAFVQLLAVLDQNPGQGWAEFIGAVDVANDPDGAADHDLAGDDGDADLTSLRL